jgi:hypothetical protein
MLAYWRLQPHFWSYYLFWSLEVWTHSSSSVSGTVTEYKNNINYLTYQLTTTTNAQTYEYDTTDNLSNSRIRKGGEDTSKITTHRSCNKVEPIYTF